MKLSRNTAAPRSPQSGGPSLGMSLAAVATGVVATAVAGVCSTAVLLIVDAVRTTGPPHALLELFGYVSVLIGSAYGAKRCDRRGWAHGAVSALASFALIVVLVNGTQGFASLGNGPGFQALALVALTGVAGGIFGLALRKS